MSTDSSHMDLILSANLHHQQQYDAHHQHHQQHQQQVYYNVGANRSTPATECSPTVSEGRTSTRRAGECAGVTPPSGSNSASMSAATAAALLLQAAASGSINSNGNVVASSPSHYHPAMRRCSIASNSSGSGLFDRQAEHELSPSFASASALTAAAQLAAAQAVGGGGTGGTTSDLQAAVLSLALAVQPPATTNTLANSSGGPGDDPRQAVSDFLLLSKRHPELITSSLASVFRRRSSGALAAASYPNTDGTVLSELSLGGGDLSEATSTSSSSFLPPTLATALGVLTPQLAGNSCGMQNFSHSATESDWDARGFPSLAAAAAASVSPPDVADVTKIPGAKRTFSPNVYAYDSQHHQQHLHRQQQHRYPVIHHHRSGSAGPITYFKHSPPTPQEQQQQVLHCHSFHNNNNNSCYSNASGGGGGGGAPTPATSYSSLRPLGMSPLSPLPTSGVLQSPPPPVSLIPESSLSPPPPAPSLTCSSLANEFASAASEFAYAGLPMHTDQHHHRMMEASGSSAAALHDEQITPTSTGGTATPDYSVISGGAGGGCGGGSGTMGTCYPEDPNRKREQRLMKNREAARECRRKKKEYVKCLEARVSLLESQNQQLIEELNKVKTLCLSELYCGLGLTGSTAACAAAAVLAVAGAVTAVPGTNYSSVPPSSSGRGGGGSKSSSGFQSLLEAPGLGSRGVGGGGIIVTTTTTSSSSASNSTGGSSSQIISAPLSDSPSPMRGQRSTAGPGMHRRRPSLLSSSLTRHQNENGGAGDGGELLMPVNLPQQSSSSVDMLAGRYGPPANNLCQPLHLQVDDNSPSGMPVKKQRGGIPDDVDNNNSYLMPAASKSPIAEGPAEVYQRRMRTSVGQSRARGPNPFGGSSSIRSAVGGRRQQQVSYGDQQQPRSQHHLASSTFQQPQMGSTAVKRCYHDAKSSSSGGANGSGGVAETLITAKSGRFAADEPVDNSGNIRGRGRQHKSSNYSNSSSSSASPSSSYTATGS